MCGIGAGGGEKEKEKEEKKTEKNQNRAFKFFSQCGACGKVEIPNRNRY
jgi:hypothetical protein